MLESKVYSADARVFSGSVQQRSVFAEALFQRVSGYMWLDRGQIEFEIFADETEQMHAVLPYWRENSGGCADFYCGGAKDETEAADEQRRLVAVPSTHLADTLPLVTTIADELGPRNPVGRKSGESQNHRP